MAIWYGEGYRANSTKGEVQRKLRANGQESLPVESPRTRLTSPATNCDNPRQVLSVRKIESKSPVSVTQTYRASARVTNCITGAPDPKKETVCTRYQLKLVQCDSKPWACKKLFLSVKTFQELNSQEPAKRQSQNRSFLGTCKVWAIAACSVNTFLRTIPYISPWRRPKHNHLGPTSCRWVWKE